MMLAEIERRLDEQKKEIDKLDEVGRAAEEATALETRATTRGRNRPKNGRIVAVEVDDALYAQLDHVAKVCGHKGVRNALLAAAKAGMRVLVAERKR